jgi:hypothetical protein
MLIGKGQVRIATPSLPVATSVSSVVAMASHLLDIVWESKILKLSCHQYSHANLDMNIHEKQMWKTA